MQPSVPANHMRPRAKIKGWEPVKNHVSDEVHTRHSVDQTQIEDVLETLCSPKLGTSEIVLSDEWYGLATSSRWMTFLTDTCAAVAHSPRTQRRTSGRRPSGRLSHLIRTPPQG